MNTKYLHVVLEDSSPVSFPITRDSITIGSDPECDIYLSHPSVSRTHARISNIEDEFLIEDLESTNGVFVNKLKLNKPIRLVSDDEIRLGAAKLRFGEPAERSKTVTAELSLDVVKSYFAIPDDSPIASLSFFYQLSDTLSCFGNEKELFARFSAILSDYFHAEYTWFFLFQRDGMKFQIEKWYRGRDCVKPRNSGLEIDGEDIDIVLKGTAFSAIYNNETPGQQHRMFIPVIIAGAVDGFFVCVAKKFSKDDLSAFTVLLAKLLGLAVKRLRDFSGNLNTSKILFGSGDVWIGQSEMSKQVVGLAGKYSLGTSPVMVSGESGTGKELIARLIHWLSDNSTGPFVAFNCAAINERLAESELFGHVKGAFTDAVEEHKGFLEQADGGTVFMDEISELSLSLQAKLLRAIETNTIRKVGDSKDTKSNFRLLTATNRNLGELVHDKKFRIDLFYRINVLSIEIPPLRKRTEDILPLLSFYMEKAAQNLKRKTPAIPMNTLDRLMEYPWPGNVRELKNSTERAMYSKDIDTLHFGDFGLSEATRNISPREYLGSGNLNEAIEMTEKKMIRRELESSRWNKTRTASVLGITRQTLDRKIERYGLDKDDQAD